MFRYSVVRINLVFIERKVVRIKMQLKKSL